ncbi:hypothetical protein C1J05_10025 [Sulfitobacter sp. JL08]|nr:hypothetical protein C1J05_10025 [Sulfitobacter sp. JL08]
MVACGGKKAKDVRSGFTGPELRPLLYPLTTCSAPLRPGKVHSAEGWEEVLKPFIARYADRHLMRFFRGDAAESCAVMVCRALQSGFGR